MSNLSSSTRSLLQAAKADRPSKESRAAIWGGVTSGLVTHTPLHITPHSGGASAGGASTGAAQAGASIAPAAIAGAGKGAALLAGSMTATMKAAFVGALIGSAISIGVATVLLRAKTPETKTPEQDQSTAHVLPGSPQGGGAIEPGGGRPMLSSSLNSGSNSGTPATSHSVGATAATSASEIELSDSKGGGGQAGVNGSNAPQAGVVANHATSRDHRNARNANGVADSHPGTPANTPANTTPSTTTNTPDDLLSREVALVSEARRDLLVGDAAGALKATRTARSLEARQLEPEEMSMQARALRALGRDKEAEKVEAALRSMYPGQGR